MKRLATSLRSVFLAVALSCLFGIGCTNGKTPTGAPTANGENPADEMATSEKPPGNSTDSNSDELKQTAAVTNPDEAVIQALEDAGATVKTSEAGRAVGVEMPRQVDAEEWELLRQLAELEELNLSWTHVRELTAVAELKSLKRLDISWTKYVTDEHIDDLVKAGQLELLVVEGTDFTEPGLQRLREALDTTVVRVNSDLALSGLPVPKPKEPVAPERRPEGKYRVGDMAPEIQGKDAAGTEFKLSDYRGKVVMLDFYGNWCPPCRAMYPHNRELIEKYQDRDFVLLGINSDPELGTLVRSKEDGKVTWRSWWDGNNGPIATDWQIPFWPSIFVIDQEGVIRYKRSSTDSMEQIAAGITGAIDSLLEPKTPDTPNVSPATTDAQRELPRNQPQEPPAADAEKADAAEPGDESSADSPVGQDASADSE